jgi:hypothetical protein
MNWLLLIADWLLAYPKWAPDDTDVTRNTELTKIKRR